MSDETRSKLNDQELIREVRRLIEVVEEQNISFKQMLVRQFFRGLFYALGASVGLSVLLAVATFLINQLEIVPLLRTITQIFQARDVFPYVH